MAAISFFRHRLRCVLLIFLISNLVLTVVRQVFDFMGYVWSPITANFLNIVFTIFAIFAAGQFRSRFFVVYICWSPFWLSWNSFLICYYLNVGALNRADSRYLSWGTGGQSWWSRHTPGCQRTYNATSATVEIRDCAYLQPFFVEIIEAIVHLLFTLIILILVAIFLINFPRKIAGEPYNSLPRRRSTTNRPHVTVEINPTPSSSSANELVDNTQTAVTNVADISFGRSSDLSSGYLNVSYDASPAALKSSGPRVPAAPVEINRAQPPQPVQNYRRSSQKRRSSSGGGSTGSVQRRTREKSRERMQNGHRQDAPKIDQRQVTNAIAADSSSAPRSRSNSTTSNPVDACDSSKVDTIRTSMSRQSQRLSRPVQGLGDLLSKNGVYPQPLQPEIPDSTRPSPKLPSDRRQPIIRPIRPVTNGQATGTIDYCIEPRRIGLVPVVTSQVKTSAGPFQPMNPVRRSVISFDPKSDSDTLLRFHDHLGRSQETIRSRASTSNQHLSYPRNLSAAPDVVSFDSGLPTSHGGISDDDPRLSHDSQTTSTSTGQQQQRQPIGYEPAFMMSYEPASSQDEPIYKPSFLKSGGNCCSPAKFRYENVPNNFTRLPPSANVLGDSDFARTNSSSQDQRISRPVNVNDRTTCIKGHDSTTFNDAVSNDGSGSDSSSVTGLAVPRISNSSLLV